MRDDFTKATIERLAKRAGYVCSKPDCRVPTVGAAQSHDGVMTVGVAAHITAAAPGGPRFDPVLTREERRHFANGIWLCETHARLIDTDGGYFTVEMLREWKRVAEERSFRLLVAPRTILTVPAPVGAAVPIDDRMARLIEATRRDLAAFRRMLGWPRHPIALNLHMRDAGGRTFNASGLAAVLQAFGQIVVVAPPGTGKTTTLLQMSDQILTLGQCLAVFLPLGEWSSQPQPFLQVISQRAAYADQQEGLFHLATEGRLVLALDGWNELDTAARKRAADHIKAFQRDYPEAGLVVSTRRQALDVPLAGPVIEIDALSQAQQQEVARALGGGSGEALLDHAWRTPGIRELVAIPLYLTSLLTHTPEGVLPTTKDEVLRLFVTEHERVADHAEALRTLLLGLHGEILRSVAVQLTTVATTSLSESQARSVIGSVEARFLQEHQMMQVPEPTIVLDTLVSHHTLVRSETGGSIAFQHQQFQEWYASFEAEALMRAAATSDDTARNRLRADILDAPAWEESILFACERLSRSDARGVRAVANAVLEAMGIDPMLAAEMIFRSSESVWEEVRAPILASVQRWHHPGAVDRAVHFMITTGRPEFAPLIWPLIATTDNHLYLATLRSGRRFRPSVLGADREARIEALPEGLRGPILAEIVHFSGLDGIELAARLAGRDTSSTVKSSVLEALLFRRADRFMADILRTAPDEVWRHLAERGYADEMSDPAAVARVRQERARMLEGATDVTQRLHLLLEDARGGASVGQTVAAIIEDPNFPARDQRGGALVYEAHRRFPEDVNRALLERLRQGSEIPFRAEELLQSPKLRIEEGPAVDRLLQTAAEQPYVGAVAAVLGRQAIGRLLETLGALLAGTPPDRRDQAFSERQFRLMRWIAATPAEEFAYALLDRPATTDPVEITQRAKLVAWHRTDENDEPLRIGGQLKRRWIAVIADWADCLLTSRTATREQLVEVASAAARLAAPELVPVIDRLLAEDLARWRKAPAERSTSPAARHEASHAYTLLYLRAFAAIGDDQVAALMLNYLTDSDFSVDAAAVLKGIWDRQHEPAQNKRFAPGTDFSQVGQRRTERQQGRGSAARCSFAEAIMAAIEPAIGAGTSEGDIARAFELAEIAFSMPYGEKPKLIEALLRFPGPLHRRRAFLTVLVQAGEIIRSADVMDAIRPLIEEARTKPWVLDPNNSPVDGWLELLPFSDQPETCLDVIEMLEPSRRNPWYLRSLVAALSQAPTTQAEPILEALARKVPALFADHGWLTAVTRRGTSSAAQLLLNLIMEGVIGTHPGADAWWLVRTFAAQIQSHAEVRAAVYEQYSTLDRGAGRRLIEGAIAEAADRAGILLLIRSYGAEGRGFDGTLHTALRQVALGERPARGWSGGKEVFSVPVPELRRDLFRMIEPDRPESVVAEACLVAIDELRDEYGAAESEPRHPDITSGRPWPRLAI